MTSIPNSLATSVSKRKLLKNIKDLYAAKGTREGHELFFRILLGEEANIFYPTEHMLRVSDGDWRAETTLRCGFTGVSGDEVINQRLLHKHLVQLQLLMMRLHSKREVYQLQN